MFRREKERSAPMSIDHTVQDGDCFDSIAMEHGFFPETLWNHGSNDDLREARKDPNVLLPGDIVHIPDLTVGEESGATEKRHRFRRRGVPARLRIVFMRPKKPEPAENTSSAPQENDPSNFEEVPRSYVEEHEPIVNAPFVLVIDGIRTEGTSDSDGLVDVPIPPNAAIGNIRFNTGTEDEVSYDLALGELAPADTVIGVRKRLYNMGFRAVPRGDESDPHLVEVLRRFQAGNDLDPTGEIDDATINKLKELHGS